MSRMMYIRVCADCGKVMHNAGPNRKRCPECSCLHSNAMKRAYSQNGHEQKKLRALAKAAQKRNDELVAENARLEALGGSYGKGRLKLWLAEQKEKACP